MAILNVLGGRGSYHWMQALGIIMIAWAAIQTSALTLSVKEPQPQQVPGKTLQSDDTPRLSVNTLLAALLLSEIFAVVAAV